MWFGYGLGAWNGADVATAAESARLVGQTDRDGLDLFTVADHPYFGAKLDAYALLSFLLGRTWADHRRGDRHQHAHPPR